MIEPGTILQERYRIERQIGQGGMGSVYIATDLRFGSTVAIKQTLTMGENYRKAIEREGRLLNSLRHPALPRVSDSFLEETGQFLVMEYIPGRDLAQMIETSGKPFPIDQVLRWADQLLDALEFLHNQSIPVIHRDIKPQNLKLTSRDQIILLDFGLAKGNPTDVECQTAAKSIFGYSRNYASMEQIEGTGTDPRSDLYSLAATLFHLATGVPPEDALTRAMSVLSGGPDTLEAASAIRPDMPRGFAGVLQAALSLNANDRPNSATEMREMLRQSENFAHLGHAITAVKHRESTGILAAKTRLMPTRSRPEFSGPGIEPAGFSEPVPESALEAQAAGRPAANRRWMKLRSLRIASALAIVILCSAVGLYFYEPWLVGARAAVPNQVAPEIKPGANSPEISGLRAGSSSEGIESNERGSQKTKPNTTAETRSTETPKVAKRPSNANTAIDRDHPGSVYVGRNVWVGHRKLPANVALDGDGVYH